MKRLLFIPLIALFAYGCQTGPKTGPTTISLTLENADFDTAELAILKDHITFEQENIKATANESGSYVFETSLNYPQIVYISMGTARTLAYVSTGGDLQINADLNNWESSVQFSGTFGAENEFLRQKMVEIDPLYGQEQIVSKIQQGTADEYAAFNKELVDKSLELMKTFKGDSKLSKEFKEWFTTDVTYQQYTNLFYYPMYFTYFNGVEPELPEGYFSFMEDAMNYEDSYFNIPSFLEFLSQHLQHSLKENQAALPVEMDDLERTLWAANEYYDGKVRDYLKATIINESLNWGDFAKAEQSFNEFKASGADQKYIDLLQASYDAVLRVSPGQPAPAFTLTNINGEQVSLTDFKGKVVYLDFWASWCAPCMRELPFAKELKKRFEEEQDIVFLYISVDEDTNAWKNTVAQQEISGVHLNINGMSNETAEMYNIKGVPTFYIIDRNGVIFNNRPGRPSSGDVIDQQLRDALGA